MAVRKEQLVDRKKREQTNVLWKDEPIVRKWLDTLADPDSHFWLDPSIGHVMADEDYRQAVEGLSFLLTGEIYVVGRSHDMDDLI